VPLRRLQFHYEGAERHPPTVFQPHDCYAHPVFVLVEDSPIRLGGAISLSLLFFHSTFFRERRFSWAAPFAARTPSEFPQPECVSSTRVSGGRFFFGGVRSSPSRIRYVHPPPFYESAPSQNTRFHKTFNLTFFGPLGFFGPSPSVNWSLCLLHGSFLFFRETIKDLSLQEDNKASFLLTNLPCTVTQMLRNKDFTFGFWRLVRLFLEHVSFFLLEPPSSHFFSPPILPPPPFVRDPCLCFFLLRSVFDAPSTSSF